MVSKRQFLRAKENFLAVQHRNQLYMGDDSHESSITHNPHAKRKTTKKVVVNRSERDYVVQTKSPEKKKPYMGRRITQRPTIVRTRHGVNVRFGRTNDCQNFIEEMTDLQPYGYDFGQFMTMNPEDWQTKFAVIYSFFSKHNSIAYKDRTIWLLVHADLLFARFLNTFYKCYTLKQFIKLCHKIRTENCVEDFRKYGPGFYPRGYLKAPDDVKLHFFHRVPIRRIAAAQTSYFKRHYPQLSYKSLKELLMTPPTFQVKMIVRDPSTHKQKVARKSRVTTAKNVKPLKIKPDMSITDPYLRVRDLKMRIKLSAEASSKDLTATIKAVGVKRVFKVNFPKPVEKLSVRQIRKNTAKHIQRNRAQKKFGKEFSSDVTGDGPTLNERVTDVLAVNSGLTAVQLSRLLGVERTDINKCLYQLESMFIVRKLQLNSESKPLWFIASATSPPSAAPISVPRAALPPPPVAPAATGDDRGLRPEIAEMVVHNILTQTPGLNVNQIRVLLSGLQMSKSELNKLLYHSKILRLDQPDPRRPPNFYAIPIVASQLNGAQGEVTGTDDLDDDRDPELCIVGDISTKSFGKRHTEHEFRSAAFVAGLAAYPKDLMTSLQKQRVYLIMTENKDKKVKTPAPTDSAQVELANFLPRDQQSSETVNALGAGLLATAMSSFNVRSTPGYERKAITPPPAFDQNYYSPLDDSEPESVSPDMSDMDAFVTNSAESEGERSKRRRIDEDVSTSETVNPIHSCDSSTKRRRPITPPTSPKAESKHPKHTKRIESPVVGQIEGAFQSFIGSSIVVQPGEVQFATQIKTRGMDLRNFVAGSGDLYVNQNFTHNHPPGSPPFTPDFVQTYLDRKLRVWEMGGDGDCFYYSVGFQIDRRIWNCKAHVAVMREMVYRFLQSNSGLFAPFHPSTEEFPSYQDFINNVNTMGRMLETDMEIRAVATVFQIVIRVFSDVDNTDHRREGHRPRVMLPYNFNSAKNYKMVDVIHVTGYQPGDIISDSSGGHYRAVLHESELLYVNRNSHVICSRFTKSSSSPKTPSPNPPSNTNISKGGEHLQKVKDMVNAYKQAKAAATVSPLHSSPPFYPLPSAPQQSAPSNASTNAPSSPATNGSSNPSTHIPNTSSSTCNPPTTNLASQETPNPNPSLSPSATSPATSPVSMPPWSPLGTPSSTPTPPSPIPPSGGIDLHSYVPLLPGDGSISPTDKTATTIPADLYGRFIHEVDTEVYTLTTSKYAKNEYGLFVLHDGEWEQVSSEGGVCETFNSLSLTPIEAQIFRGALEESGGLNLFTKTGKRKRCVRNPIEEIRDFTYSTRTYRWFTGLRTRLDHFFTPDRMYNGYAENTRTIFVDRQVYSSLRRKITSNTSDLMYLSIFNAVANNSESLSIVVDTVLYLYELKTRVQSQLTANVEAHASFLGTKRFWQYPSSGVSVDPFKETYTTSDEGLVKISSRSEALSSHNSGVVCVARQEYTECSKIYGNYNNPVRKPGQMLEPLNSSEEKYMKERGVSFKDPYIKFDYSEPSRTIPYQSVAGGFATTAAVIDHTSVRECEMAHSRLLFSRDDELEQRYKATRFWDEACIFFDLINSQDDLSFVERYSKVETQVVKGIRSLDPDYLGGNQIYLDYDAAGKFHTELPPQTLLQAFVQACIHDVQASIIVDHEDARDFDDIDAMEAYIHEIGAKLPLRLGLVKSIRDRMTKNVASKVNLVQCKPHEFQKYKIVQGQPALKYARDVVSITGEDWVAAKPHLLAYVKKTLEGVFSIRLLYPEPTISRTHHSDSITVQVAYQLHGEGVRPQDIIKEYSVPRNLCRMLSTRTLPIGLKFRYRSVITDTSLESLSNIMTDVHDELLAEPGLIYAMTHGDDQIIGVHNVDPEYFEGRVGVFYIEGDINDNDGSHVDPFYRLDLRTFAKRTEDVPIEAFIQLSKPLMLVNPQNTDQYCVLRRRHGMQMCSGSVHTTYGNSKMSMNVALSQMFNPRMEYGTAASTVGMNVTSMYGDLSDVTFLSKNFYFAHQPSTSLIRNGRMVIKCFSDLASLARKVSRCTSDVAGKTSEPVCKRFDDHNRMVVQGWVHEPDSLFKLTMNRRYVEHCPKYKRIFRRWIQIPQIHLLKTIKEQDLTPIDFAIITHYYPNELDVGVVEYLTCVNLINTSDTYGTLIKSRFIDRIMSRRYGMLPVVDTN